MGACVLLVDVALHGELLAPAASRDGAMASLMGAGAFAAPPITAGHEYLGHAS